MMDTVEELRRDKYFLEHQFDEPPCRRCTEYKECDFNHDYEECWEVLGDWE